MLRAPIWSQSYSLLALALFDRTISRHFVDPLCFQSKSHLSSAIDGHFLAIFGFYAWTPISGSNPPLFWDPQWRAAHLPADQFHIVVLPVARFSCLLTFHFRAIRKSQPDLLASLICTWACMPRGERIGWGREPQCSARKRNGKFHDGAIKFTSLQRWSDNRAGDCRNYPSTSNSAVLSNVNKPSTSDSA